MNLSRVVCFLCTIYLAGCWRDWVGKQPKWRILSLSQELVEDAMLKWKQTVDIRREHSHYIAYDVGVMIGQIREKYKIMMEHYRICLTRYKNLFNYHTPRIEHFRTVAYFQRAELIILLELEIEKLVDALEKAPLNVELYQTHLISAHADKLVRLRATEDSSDEDEKQKELEEAVKSRYREEFLMKRLNSSGQSTPKKRFVNKWPVPGTWSLEMY